MTSLTGLTVSLAEQLENVRVWNERRGWGFTERDFDDVNLTHLSRSGPVVDVIAVYLPRRGLTSGVQRTFEELWAVAAQQQTDVWRWDGLKSDWMHLRLLAGIKHVPGIRRVMLDLSAYNDWYNGILPIEVSNKNSAHAEILAAAAHFPAWVDAMDGLTNPYVLLSGYRASASLRRMPWHDMPCLRGNGLIALDVEPTIYRQFKHAAPTVSVVRRPL